MLSFYSVLACYAIFIVMAHGQAMNLARHLTGDSYLRPRQVNATATIGGSLGPTAVASTASCANSCTVCATNAPSLYWTPYTFTDTTVAATVVKIVNTVDDTTRTTTIFNDLPAGYTLPPTNAQGTQVTTVTFTRSGTTTTTDIAFPSGFLEWGDGYTWEGILQTKLDGASDSTCVTATTSSFVPLLSFPQPSATMTTRTDGTDDPQGLLFKPTFGFGLMEAYIDVYTDQGALQTCSPCPLPAPAIQALTVRFITDTSTSYESLGSTEASTVQSSLPEPPAPDGPAARTSSSLTRNLQTVESSGHSRTVSDNTAETQVPSSVITGSQALASTIKGAQAATTTDDGTQASSAGVATHNLFTTSIGGPSGSSTITAISGDAPPEGSTTKNEFTTVIAGASGSTTMTAIIDTSSTAGSVASAAEGVFTTVITGDSGPITILALSAGASPAESMTKNLYTTVIAGPYGPTTITAVSAAISPGGSVTNSVYTTVVSGTSGPITLTAVNAGFSLTASNIFTTVIAGQLGPSTITAISATTSTSAAVSTSTFTTRQTESSVGETSTFVVISASPSAVTTTLGGATIPGLQTNQANSSRGRKIILIIALACMSILVL